MNAKILLFTLLPLLHTPALWADYPETILNDAPIAYYRFEEPAGATAIADSSGNDLGGTVTERGGRYTSQHISWMGSASFVHDEETDTVCLRGGANGRGDRDVPFCPRRPHEHRQSAPVRITVGYKAGMISFVLFVTECFKSSCDGQTFLPHVSLRTWIPFPCRTLSKSTGSVFRRVFTGRDIRIKELIARDIDCDGDTSSSDCESESDDHTAAIQGKTTRVGPRMRELVHGGKGAAAILGGDQIEYATTNVFAALINSREDELLFYGQLANGWYVLCLTGDRKSGIQPTVYVTHDHTLVLANEEITTRLPKTVYKALAALAASH